MSRLLCAPFDSPHVVRIADHLTPPPDAPILTLFLLLAEGCSGGGLKATAKGFLPRRLCQEAAAAFTETTSEEVNFGAPVRRELDFEQLHVVRIVARMAGLLRKSKGRFLRTKKCEKILSGDARGAAYLVLFRTYCERFNWAYRDGYPQLSLIQQSFLFTLFLLQIHGKTFRDASFYADAFLRAFPGLIDEVEAAPLHDEERTVRNAYRLRAIRRFAHFFGLVENRPGDVVGFDRGTRLRKLPLLDRLITFSR
jgi:hypothetical protein